MFKKSHKMQAKKFVKRSRQRIFFVGQNSGFHGLNRLFNPRANLLSRLFWLFIIIGSIGGLYLMMEPVVELGMEIHYTPDTLYLNWTTQFPAVTLCEVHNAKIASRKFLALYPDLFKLLGYNFGRVLTDLLYARGKCTHDQCAPCGATVPCDMPWRDVIERLHSTCNEMLTECSFGGVPFPCCEHFVQVDSEHGPCFSFNTLQHKDFQPLFVVNRTTGPGVLTLRLLVDAEVSLHSTEELSTNNLDERLKEVLYSYRGNRMDWQFAVVEIDNDRQLQNEHINERQCRFLHEIPDEILHTYSVYSYGACRLAKSTQETFARCGCIHPVRDLSYTKYYCNYTGINCWNTFKAQKLSAGLEDSSVALEECLPSCHEAELSIVQFSESWVPEEDDKTGILVNIKMAYLPSMRYKRNLMKTHLDGVVSVGGIAGLFFSASILSFLEIFYLFFRPQKFENIK